MFTLTGTISAIQYETAATYCLKKFSHTAPTMLQPFLQSLSGCSQEVTTTIIENVAERDILSVFVYFVSKNQQKIIDFLEKTFAKKGILLEIKAISLILDDIKPFLRIQVDFILKGSSHKVLQPFFSQTLLKKLCNIKVLSDALLSLLTTTLATHWDFVTVEQLALSVS